MILKRLDGGGSGCCSVGTKCPASFINENGDFAFIGKKIALSEIENEISMSPDENIVLVPRAVALSIFSELNIK